MRVLFLASYFPRPGKPQIGTWALEQAKALAHVSDLRAVCCTSYIPGILSIIPRARPWSSIPRHHQWDNVSVEYLKTLYYPIQPFKRWAYPDPQRQMSIAWRSVRSNLLAAVDKFKPDVILAHHTAVNGYFAERLHQITKLPYVVSDYDFHEIADCEKYPGRRALFDRVLRNATANICASRRMEKDMRRLFPFARVSTIHQSILPHPPELFSTPRLESLRDKQIIFSAAMFVHRKGIPLLIEAFAKIAHKHPNAILRLAGDGEQRPQIEAAIAQFQLSSRVQLLGLLSHRQVLQEMVWSDLFALVSWDEPFATVFLEAMAAGKPIVTASDGGINDVVIDRVHGRVVPPRDVAAAAEALDQLLSDDAARLAMGRYALELVNEGLTWEAASRRLLSVFNEALQVAETPHSAETVWTAA